MDGCIRTSTTTNSLIVYCNRMYTQDAARELTTTRYYRRESGWSRILLRENTIESTDYEVFCTQALNADKHWHTYTRYYSSRHISTTLPSVSVTVYSCDCSRLMTLFTVGGARGCGYREKGKVPKWWAIWHVVIKCLIGNCARDLVIKTHGWSGCVYSLVCECASMWVGVCFDLVSFVIPVCARWFTTISEIWKQNFNFRTRLKT